MSTEQRRWLVAGLVAGGCFLLICLAGAAIAVGYLLFRAPAWAVDAFPTQATPTVEAATGTEAPVATPAGLGSDLETLRAQVIEIRGLRPTGPVREEVLDMPGLRQRMEQDLAEDYSRQEAADDVLGLAVLGLLEPDFDLYALYLDLYSEQVAGFYDPEDQLMVIVSGQAFGGPERLTYAHEYVHVLQDQNFDLTALGYTDQDCEVNQEACWALSALIEGDATLASLEWFQRFATDEDRRQITEFYSDFESSVYDAAPAFIKKDLLFPYQQGELFVQSLLDAGGWPAVDRAYASPPRSTEQVLHPERYPADLPMDLDLPPLEALLDGEWRQVDGGELGEWLMRLVLEAHLPEDQAAQAAEGWGGDAFVTFYSEAAERWLLVLTTTWDTPADLEEFVDAFEDYQRGRFGTPTEAGCYAAGRFGVSCLQSTSDTTLWVVAPDLATVQAVQEQVTSP